MAKTFAYIDIKHERRLCTVDGELGYFHCWEHYSTVIEPSPMIGGHPGGTISYIRGVVEFTDGVRPVMMNSIKFCDEENKFLNDMQEYYMKKGENDD